MAEDFDRKRIKLAERIASVEEVSFEAAIRMIPGDKAGVDRLVASLNARRGGPRTADERKISRANERAHKEKISFTEAAKKTR